MHKRSGAGTSRPATVTLRGNDSASEPVPGTVSNPGDTHSTVARRCEHSEDTRYNSLALELEKESMLMSKGSLIVIC